jgi:hypothetical protein
MRTSRPANGSRPSNRRQAGRAAVAVVAALFLLGLVAGPAAASVASVAAALGRDPVYRDTSVGFLSAQDASRLLAKVEAADTPIFIAILSEDARREVGNTKDLAVAIGRTVGRPGTYLVTSGTQYATGNFGGAVSSAEAARLAKQAFDTNRGDLNAGLLQWVDGVAAAAQGEPVGQAGGGDGGGGAGGVIGAVAVLTVLAVGGGALIFGMRRRRREREAERLRELEEVKTVATEDLVALSDDIRALDMDTSMPDADQEAVRHYTDAVDQYQRAATALDRARRTEDLAPMSAALEAGRFSMASAKAILEGRPPPERRPPCFFDPRHGPSVEDVQWAPPDGAPRMVPACAADAQRVHDGLEPESRQVLAGAGGRMTPYWNAPGYYGPWAGGYFGGFPMGGLFTGLLLGSFLGGGWGHPVYVGGDGGDGGDGGGGDGGGGDAGGGDVGGDWGGGDWGGGDWGGGDFGGGDFGG